MIRHDGLTREMRYALECWAQGSGCAGHRGFRLPTVKALVNRGLLETATGLPLETRWQICSITEAGRAALKESD